jgi:hypothetical protein
VAKTAQPHQKRAIDNRKILVPSKFPNTSVTNCLQKDEYKNFIFLKSLKVNSRNPITILEAKPKQEATNAGVRQDKYPPGRIGVALVQPQSAERQQISAKKALPPPNPPADNRPKHHGSETRQTGQIWGRAPLATKAKIHAIAKSQGLSVSEVVVNLVHKALQIDGDLQYGAMLRPVIQDQIHKDMQSYSNRNYNMNFQTLYAAENNRLLTIHVLRFLTDLVDESDQLVPIITACQQNAMENIKKMFSEVSIMVSATLYARYLDN